MFILYLDESGQHGGGHFTLGGVAVHERQTYWLAQQVEKLQKQYLAEQDEPMEFHASAIRGGAEEPWCRLNHRERYALLDDTYQLIAESHVTLFGIAIERAWLFEERNEYAYAFESLTKQFDHFLRRKYRDEDDPQRGLIVVAESEFRRRIETLAMRIRKEGTRWGELRNLAEIPLFTSSANSRLLQVADFVANAVFGRYEGGYTRQFDKIVPRFDQNEGVYYGLWHYCGDHRECSCPACLSRRMSGGLPSTDIPDS